MKKLNSNLPQTEVLNITSVMRSFLREIIDTHKFFVKESKTYIGVFKKDTSKPMLPTFGYMQDWQTKPFSTKNKIWTVNGFEYPKTLRYKFKDLLYYPIAYCKFMINCIKDAIRLNRKIKRRTI